MDEDEGLIHWTERGKETKRCWRMNIGQTPIEGQRHVPDKALADGG